MKNSMRNSSIFIVLIIFCTLFLSVGYAKIDGVDLVMRGTASIKRTGLFIDSVTYVSNNNANVTGSNINDYNDMIMNSTIVLGNTLDSTITYKVTVKNNTADTMYFLDTVYEHSASFYSNDDITFTLDGLECGDYINPNGTLSFNITFKYVSGLANITNQTLNSYLKFKFSKDKYNYYEDYLSLNNACANTGVALFSTANIDKDFVVGFELGTNTYSQNMTPFSAKNYTNGNIGFAIRYQNRNRMQLEGTAGTQSYNVNNTQSFEIRRINKELYIGTNGAEPTRVGSLASATAFNTLATFGCSLNNSGNGERFYNGIITNAYVRLIDFYYVAFDANGGSGTMTNQKINMGESVELTANAFTNTGHTFLHWNTQNNDSGDSFENGEAVKNLVGDGQTIRLYAIWS